VTDPAAPQATARAVVLARPLSPKACAELAGLSYHTILRAIRGGHLRAFHPPGTTIYRVAPEDFEEWLYGHPVAPTPIVQPERARTRQTPAPTRGSVEALTAIEGEAA
jgi:excisionase family DNA binding protein